MEGTDCANLGTVLYKIRDQGTKVEMGEWFFLNRKLALPHIRSLLDNNSGMVLFALFACRVISRNELTCKKNYHLLEPTNALRSDWTT